MSNTAPPKEWIVTVDGADRRVVAESDEVSGRVQIRVDGRMAARALAPGESERRFTIGPAAYLLRRDASGDLELDVDPDGPLPAVPPPAYKRPAPPAEKPRSRARSAIIGVVVTLILIPAARWGVDAVRYMRVPWEAYTDSARQFRVAFAGLPERSTDVVQAGDATVQTVKLETRYHNHLYVLEWLEFPFVIPAEREGDLILRALDVMIASEKAKLVERGWSRAAGRDSMHFVLHMPENDDWSGGTARGHVVRHGRRLYIQYAYVPRGESLGYDVGEYLRSLELPDDDG